MVLGIVHVQAVPVRPGAKSRALMGTVRVHWRRSISVSLVKKSVTGFLVYLSAYDILG